MLVDESRSGRPIFVSLNASPRVGAFLEKPVSQFSLLNSMREAIGLHFRRRLHRRWQLMFSKIPRLTTMI